MAKRLGRGFATIEYPTGMNQNGDPSQAWIKLKPDGRVDFELFRRDVEDPLAHPLGREANGVAADERAARGERSGADR